MALHAGLSMRMVVRKASRLGLCLMVCISLMTAGSQRLSAQDRWETSPYRIRVVLVNDGSASWTENRMDEFSRRILAGAASSFGKLWKTEVILADDQQTAAVHDLGNGPPVGQSVRPFVELAQQTGDAVDKLIYVSLSQTQDGLRVLSFEHDLRFKYFGEPVMIDLSDFAAVESSLLRMVAAAFGSNARIAAVGPEVVSVRPRGLLLPVRDAGVKSCQVGAVLQLMQIGQQDATDANDASAPDDVGTFLVVRKAGPIVADCRIVSRYDEPLASFSAGSIVARQIRPLHEATTVQFLNTADGGQPLIGLELALVQGNASAETIGTTDRQGRFTLHASGMNASAAGAAASPLAELMIRCCGQDLLRLPVVVGWKSNQICRMSIDAERFASLAAIEQHRAKLRDLIAIREIGLARAAGYAAANDQPAADQQLRQVQQAMRESKSKLLAAVNADRQTLLVTPSAQQNAHHWKKLTEDIEAELAETRIVLN